MRIVAHVNRFYDWVPVPDDVKVTDADIKSERVKPSGGGGWLMKVTKSAPSTTEIMLPEEQIIAKVIHDKTRPEGGRTLTRSQAVAFYLSENVMPHHAHRSWITKFEVHDTEGPDEALMRAMLLPHTIPEAAKVAFCTSEGKHTYEGANARCNNCGHALGADLADAPNIDPADVDAHVAAYMQTVETKAHEDSLHRHFKVKGVAQ